MIKQRADLEVTMLKQKVDFDSNLLKLELRLMSQLKLRVRHSVRSPPGVTKPDYAQEQFVLFFSELSSKTRSSRITA